MIESFLGDADRRKTSVDHLQKIAVEELNGYVITGLKRHLAAKFKFRKIRENHHE
jgi:hypothetical protein